MEAEPASGAETIPLRIIQPLFEETDEHFRQRMQTMTALLAELDPSLIAVVIQRAPGRITCLVSQILAERAVG